VVAAILMVMALALLHVAWAVAVVMGAHNVAASLTHQVMVSTSLAMAPHPSPSAKSATRLATPPRSAGTAMRMTPTSSDNNWYTNSGATYHVTGDLDKLTMHDTYDGHDQFHAANGSGMHNAHIGTSITPTPTRTLTLNNVLHVPSTQKNLLSVHQFTLDNDTFIVFHPYFFY
jgi:hypothetical protein